MESQFSDINTVPRPAMGPLWPVFVAVRCAAIHVFVLGKFCPPKYYRQPCRRGMQMLDNTISRKIERQRQKSSDDMVVDSQSLFSARLPYLDLRRLPTGRESGPLLFLQFPSEKSPLTSTEASSLPANTIESY